MSKVVPSTIARIIKYVDGLPQENVTKCRLCTETLTNLVMKAQVATGAPLATVTTALADRVNANAAPGDIVTAKALKCRINRIKNPELKSSNRALKTKEQEDLKARTELLSDEGQEDLKARTELLSDEGQIKHDSEIGTDSMIAAINSGIPDGQEAIRPKHALNPMVMNMVIKRILGRVPFDHEKRKFAIKSMIDFLTKELNRTE